MGKSRSFDELSLTDEQKQLAEKKILKAADDGRIQCARALAIAKEMKVSTRDIGRLADMMDLRISKCSLNCFWKFFNKFSELIIPEKLLSSNLGNFNLVRLKRYRACPLVY